MSYINRSKSVKALCDEMIANLPPEVPAFDLHAHIQRQKEWSLKTFGEGLRTIGITRHIRHELREIVNAPNDLEEWIDVIGLALDGAWRTGATPDEIVAILVAKQQKNFARRWEKPVDQNTPTHHLK